MRIFRDIDGTLTDNPDGLGNVFDDRLAKLQALIRQGHEVVVWSANGKEYARTFCDANGLSPVVALGKPDLVIDDKPTFRKAGLMALLDGGEFVWADLSQADLPAWLTTRNEALRHDSDAVSLSVPKCPACGGPHVNAVFNRAGDGYTGVCPFSNRQVAVQLSFHAS